MSFNEYTDTQSLVINVRKFSTLNHIVVYNAMISTFGMLKTNYILNMYPDYISLFIKHFGE